jgi:hypothetical protein
MDDATHNRPSADEIIAAVRSIRDHRDELLNRIDDVYAVMDVVKYERDQARRQLEEATKDDLVIRIVDLPTGRGWAFVEDAKLLAISPDLDEATKARLMSQIEPPKLTTCDACGAPVYEGNDCTMH